MKHIKMKDYNLMLKKIDNTPFTETSEIDIASAKYKISKQILDLKAIDKQAVFQIKAYYKLLINKAIYPKSRIKKLEYFEGMLSKINEDTFVFENGETIYFDSIEYIIE